MDYGLDSRGTWHFSADYKCIGSGAERIHPTEPNKPTLDCVVLRNVKEKGGFFYFSLNID